MLRRRTAQGAFASGLVAIAVSLPGCTAPSPTPADLTAGVGTPSAHATPPRDVLVRPTPPPAMERRDADAAAAVGTYFVALYDYAFASGDISGFDALAAEGCEFCRSVIEDITSSRAAAQYEEGGGTTVRSASGTVITPETFSAALRVDQAASTRRTSTDEVVSTTPADEFDLLIAIRWSDGWSVEAVDVLEPGTVTAS